MLIKPDNTLERGHHNRQASEPIEKHESSRISRPRLDYKLGSHDTTGLNPIGFVIEWVGIKDNRLSSISPSLAMAVRTRMAVRCSCSEDGQRKLLQLSAEHWWLSWASSACEQSCKAGAKVIRSLVK